MINFCKTSIHSILGIPNSDDRRNPSHRLSHIFPPPDRGGLGLRLLATDSPKPPHVIESPAVGPATGCEKSPDPGAWGLHESTGALDRCTESLGSESCDSGIEIDEKDESAAEAIDRRNARRQLWRRKAEVKFPPPLSWMTGRGGRRSRFLKGERRDGRFVLTEIRIDHPPEILRAIRGDGRLRLELVEVERGEESNERWEMLRVRNERQRCVEAVNGDGDSTTHLWCNNQCFATTA